jgi:hypothetical protein
LLFIHFFNFFLSSLLTINNLLFLLSIIIFLLLLDNNTSVFNEISSKLVNFSNNPFIIFFIRSFSYVSFSYVSFLIFVILYDQNDILIIEFLLLSLSIKCCFLYLYSSLLFFNSIISNLSSNICF